MLDDDGGSSMMLFYDRERKAFGEVPVLVDQHPSMKDTYFPALLAGKLSINTLDEVIAKQINRIFIQDILLGDLSLMSAKELTPNLKELCNIPLMYIVYK